MKLVYKNVKFLLPLCVYVGLRAPVSSRQIPPIKFDPSNYGIVTVADDRSTVYLKGKDSQGRSAHISLPRWIVMDIVRIKYGLRAIKSVLNGISESDNHEIVFEHILPFLSPLDASRRQILSELNEELFEIQDNNIKNTISYGAMQVIPDISGQNAYCISRPIKMEVIKKIKPSFIEENDMGHKKFLAQYCLVAPDNREIARMLVIYTAPRGLDDNNPKHRNLARYPLIVWRSGTNLIGQPLTRLSYQELKVLENMDASSIKKMFMWDLSTFTSTSIYPDFFCDGPGYSDQKPALKFLKPEQIVYLFDTAKSVIGDKTKIDDIKRHMRNALTLPERTRVGFSFTMPEVSP